MIIIRGYELLLPLLIILYAFATKAVPLYQRGLVGIAMLLSVPFMGIEDSRGRVLALAISVLAFVPSRTFFKLAFRRIRVYLAAILVLGSFSYYSAVRLEKYYSAGDYLQIEVFQRLDGLNLVTKLRESRLLSYYGEFDPMILSPLISKIPLLDAAREAKLMGRTSSKQYYIQDILRNKNLDDSNSMIADPLYFGGIAGLILCFALLGYLAMRFDAFIRRRRLFEGRIETTLAIAFGTSFIMFENDFVFAIVTMLQSLILVAGILWFGCRRLPSVVPRMQHAHTASFTPDLNAAPAK
jgi:hypothetical protein